MSSILFCIFILSLSSCAECFTFPFFNVNHTVSSTPWPGKWFPMKPTENPLNSDLSMSNQLMNHQRVPMGVSNPDCDDAKMKLEMDWNNDPINHTCYSHHSYYEPDINVRPIEEIDNIPPMYKADHMCMSQPINYDDIIPTFGTHRPLWAKWGEYMFLPKQRWLHNLEHGGIVMLYHPCANKLEVKKLRNLVTKCLYRHIITPYNLLKMKTPLALVAWGRKIQMSVVSNKIVTDFIKEAALRGPEQISKNGQYGLNLIKEAEIVSNINDGNLCPNKQ